MQILTHRQIEQKITRLAHEVLENNYKEKEIILAGINNNGVGFAKLLQAELQRISNIEIKLTKISLNPANPLKTEIVFELEPKAVKNKVIIVVDDVANTGRTLFYATKPLFDTLPKKIEMAVLIERHHKSFPMKVDYVGLSLATTLKENIEVQIPPKSKWSVKLN